jgi:hypothetical protein
MMNAQFLILNVEFCIHTFALIRTDSAAIAILSGVPSLHAYGKRGDDIGKIPTEVEAGLSHTAPVGESPRPHFEFCIHTFALIP